VPVGNNPLGVAVNLDGSKVYVTNYNSSTTSVIDTSTNTVTATVPVGSNPYGVAVNPNGAKVYVTNTASGNVSVIDTATNTVVATVPVVGGPDGIAVIPDGTKIYVANNESNTVSVINTSTNTVTATVPVGIWPYGVAITPAGSKVYVANFYSNTTSVIDTSTNTVTATVPVGSYPRGVAVIPDGTKVYVADTNISIINTSTNTVTSTVPVGKWPYAFGKFIGDPVTVTPLEDPITVTTPTTATGTICKEVNDYLPKYPDGVALKIINKVGSDILVVWTKADSKKPVFKVNVLTEQNRTVTTPTGNFDEYIRTGYSWYRVSQPTNDGHTQLKSGYTYTVTYYWGSNGTGLEPIPDSEAPEI